MDTTERLHFHFHLKQDEEFNTGRAAAVQPEGSMQEPLRGPGASGIGEAWGGGACVQLLCVTGLACGEDV